MRILITGGTGFLGTNLTKRLKKLYYNVYTFGSKHYDIRDYSMAKYVIDQVKPDAIIHAAGTVGGISANKENPGKFMYENLVMGTNMIHAAMEANTSKFVLLGTVCSYPKITQVPFSEKDIWNGYPEETNAPYGIAKKTLMLLAKTYHEQYGMNTVNLIPVNMYGPYDHFNLTSSHVIPALILKFKQAIDTKQKEVVIWGTGQASREFLYVEDCCRAISLCLNSSDIGPEPINIGTGKEIKICELVEVLADIMGYDGNIVYDTTKPDGQPRRCLDISLAKEKLNFQATTMLKEGLNKTVEWFKKT